MARNNGETLSGAVGTATQFMPNAPQVYQQQFTNIQTSNPMARNTSYEETLANGLSSLGIAWGKYMSDEEERKYNIAKTQASQAYELMTDQQKHELDARAILRQSGKFNLQDDDYAIATIDKMKGTTVGQHIQTEWELYKEQRRTNPTLEDEFKDFDSFYQAKLGEMVDKETIGNQYAFNNGLAEQHMKSTLDVHQEFQSKTEERLKLERLNGIKADVGAWARQHPNATTEEATSYIQNLMGTIKATVTSDSNLEYQLLNEVTKGLSQTGGATLLDIWGEQEWANGQKVNELIDIAPQKDVANAVAERIGNERYVGLHKKLAGLTTKKAVEDWYTDLEKNWPEDYRLMFGEKENRIHEIEAEERRKAKEAMLKQALAQKTAVGTGLAGSVFNALTKGQTTINGMQMPMSDADVKAMGGDPDTFKSNFNQIVYNAMANGQYDGLEHIFSYNYGMQYARQFMSQQMSASMAGMQEGGGVPEIVQMALNMRRAKPALVNQILDKKYAGQIIALDVLQQANGEAEGTAQFARAMTKLRVPEAEQQVESEIDSQGFVPMGVLDADDYGNWSNFTPDPISNASMVQEIKETAKIYRAGGQSSYEAVYNAEKDVMHNYVQYGGQFIPAIVLSDIASDQEYATKCLKYALDKEKDNIGTNCTVDFDGNTNMLTISDYGTGISKSYTLAEMSSLGYQYGQDYSVMSQPTPSEEYQAQHFYDYANLPI